MSFHISSIVDRHSGDRDVVLQDCDEASPVKPLVTIPIRDMTTCVSSDVPEFVIDGKIGALVIFCLTAEVTLWRSVARIVTSFKT
jgi:hypothetical protein